MGLFVAGSATKDFNLLPTTATKKIVLSKTSQTKSVRVIASGNTLLTPSSIAKEVVRLFNNNLKGVT